VGASGWREREREGGRRVAERGRRVAECCEKGDSERLRAEE